MGRRVGTYWERLSAGCTGGALPSFANKMTKNSIACRCTLKSGGYRKVLV
ncbi:hypothetical protein T12_5769 [Trichinella patagoniensis]|uniref:Uncharacterized protein n=1 Tax=Trichinella patagoniensis TaxID=990121 RepID=A0A0V0ZJY5_9BILA|nr:hypothetical protein T12_5769 [Trichinella patagoniensis]